MGTYDGIAARVERELRDGLSRRREGIIDDDVSVRSVGDRVVLSVAYGRRDTHEIELFDGNAIPLAVEMPRRVPQDVEWQLESVCRKGIDAFVGFAEGVPELKEAVAAREGRLAEAKGMEDAVKAMLSSDGWRSARSELRALREAGDPELMVGVPYEYVVDRIDTDVDPSSLAATVTVTYQGIYDDDPGDHYNYGFRFKLFNGQGVSLGDPEFRDLGEGDRWTSWERGDRHNPPDAVGKAADGFAAAAREAFASTAREFAKEGKGPSVLNQAVSPALMERADKAISDGDLKSLRQALAAGADPRQKDVNGWTLLESACLKGRIECIPVIAEAAGAEILFPSGKDGYPPLLFALSNSPETDHARIVATFVAGLPKGRSVEELCGPGTTPLHRIAGWMDGKKDMAAAAAALVSAGNRADAHDANGRTPAEAALDASLRNGFAGWVRAWDFAAGLSGRKGSGLAVDSRSAVIDPSKVGAFLKAACSPKVAPAAREVAVRIAKELGGWFSTAVNNGWTDARAAFPGLVGDLGKGPVAEAFLAKFPEAAAREVDGVSTFVWKEKDGYKALAVAPNGEASVARNPLPTMKAAASAAMQGLSYDPWTSKPETPKRSNPALARLKAKAEAAATGVGASVGRKGPGL